VRRIGSGGEGVTKQPESYILSAVRQALLFSGWKVMRNQQGLGSVPGRSDLEALRDGKTVYIEIKTATGVQSDKQKDFEADIVHHGGEYWIVRCVEDLRDAGLVDMLNL
jgi:hypothetical protein